MANNNDHAAKAAWWITEGHGPTDTIGPLLMHIDVPEPSHRPFVEEAISKYAYAFLAKTQEAQRAVHAKIRDEKWTLNAYFNPGTKYTPGKRPSSESMRRFGITKWLDEALHIAPEHRDQILSGLKDLGMIDKWAARVLAFARTSAASAVAAPACSASVKPACSPTNSPLLPRPADGFWAPVKRWSALRSYSNSSQTLASTR